ncbi:thiosulfate oxidation carrier complex protein SoxZ [Ramlibacter alkalitolerans]|uniref:Thiosulfate oxidation carrier complex protein SoxZ n=1 Tax=Ramlibacter alkalitolerans TaxID=2039631 RepID=A0ABS1JLN1_9BURK|nr:thiosulfate oxidation carrier complex protein SoxZ [Ramlibacter alkalitolerans]MBL0425138.1 thiosulfate oxidation carrier complex protein SoxZ [Ramlibacter alkalitolerans]
MAARTLIQFPATAALGEAVQVRVTIAHAMESGFRPGMDGKPVPRDILRRFTCRYNGEVVFSAELSPAIAANPYLAFHLVADRSGTLEFEWQGDHGFSQVEQRPLQVT